MRLPLLPLLAAASAFAQPLTFGVKAGMPLTDFLSTVESQRVEGVLGIFPGFFSNTRPYVLGATAELRLPASLGLELDALYRRTNYSGTDLANNGLNVITTTISSTSANAWEFPLLLKYRFHVPVLRPYADAGYAWDTLAGLTQAIRQTVATITNSSTTSTPADLNKKGTGGFVVGAGLEIHALFIHVSPEVRYTRWISPHFQDPAGLVESKQNQAEFLLGITF
jgi:opacity protein-like surface antigen